MTGPTVERPPSPGAKRKREDEEDAEAHTVPNESKTDEGAKRAKVIGPTLPPHLANKDSGEDEREEESSSESDDDYGPGLPPTEPAATMSTYREEAIDVKDRTEEQTSSKPNTSQRDAWMLQPPGSDDWSSRVDPTKLRNRKFNTGKSTAAAARSGQPGGGTWTETPEQKRKRLEAEVMGIQAPATSTDADAPKTTESDAAMAKRVQDYNEKKRNTTLYSQHQTKRSKEEEDDPSSRPFDKEKDIRGPTKVNNAQRREFMNKASDFGSRFAGGKFL